MDVLAAGVAHGTGGGFLADADPVLAIADELIPGTNINFRDAFTVAVSPGVTQSLGSGPTSVPEPATYGLLATALAALQFAHRKRQRFPVA